MVLVDCGGGDAINPGSGAIVDLLYDIEVSVRAPEAVQSVTCVPAGEGLPFEQKDGYVTVTVPVSEGHQMTVPAPADDCFVFADLTGRGR